ncbi:MAG TPA: 4-alpha-glucanotransferase [Rhodospirillaceae bacterium]|nr:4-alpha-glucanotransferase [Rhodospirillaceae bacterium]
MTLSALDRLANLAGIEEGWWDFFGQYRVVSDATKRAFLSAMGFAIESEEALLQSLADLESRSWRRWLEPVLVTKENDAPPTILLSLAADHPDEPMRWSLQEDNGTLHRGQADLGQLPVIGQFQATDRLYRRLGLSLPGMPWPGVHLFHIETDSGICASMTLIVAPAQAHSPGGNPKRFWGFATQLYALNGQENWGVGDFSALAALGRQAATLGASTIGINPLHALFANQPERFSPYSPSSRHCLNIVYIDVAAVPEFRTSPQAQALFHQPAWQKRLAPAKSAKQVDYPLVGRLKREVLERVWQSLSQGESPERLAAFRSFQASSEQRIGPFATFEALQEFFMQGPKPRSYWRDWPKKYQDPESKAVTQFARAHKDRIDFFWYLQWLAEEQLEQAQQACRTAGMALGLYRDLAVGIAGDGAEAWANQALLCLGVSVGAPPDPLNLAGQDWGLAPFNPLALKEAAYQPLLAVLEANMSHAGALRLDHAMSLQRLYWVPRGCKADEGAYVRYPVDDLFHLVTLASARAQCLVIGEDLGTVPDGFRARMAERDILGYRLLVFEQTEDRFKRPDEMSEQTLVALGTHDLPSLGGWWAGIDIAARTRLALYPKAAMEEEEARERATSRLRLVAALAEEKLLDPHFPTTAPLSVKQCQQLAHALYNYLARSPARLLMVQFEDVLGLSMQLNLPGTVDQHPNWRWRFSLDPAAMTSEPSLKRLADLLSSHIS